MATVCVSSTKGGCGKSTTAICIAAELALDGYRVALHMRQGGDQGEGVGDAVVDLPQHQLGPVAGLAHLGLGPLLVPAQRLL
ncbi:MAG: ParA family protein, partial [Oxalobacteraceae bacterium]